MDLSEYYDERVKHDHEIIPYINFESLDSDDQNLKILAVDVSICDSFENIEHQGIKQAFFVEQKLDEFPILKPVCLMLKKLLVKNN